MQSAVWLIGLELFTWFMSQLDSFLSPCIFQRKTNDAVLSGHEKKNGPASSIYLVGGTLVEGVSSVFSKIICKNHLLKNVTILTV